MMQVPPVAAREFTLAIEDGWDSTHLLSEPGSQQRALCGKRPTIVWKRIWVEVAASHEDLPACARCVGVIATSSARTDLRKA